MKQLKLMISGGGTGGHIFPALAIANAVKQRYPDTEILFVGALDRMEMSRVPAAGYKIVGLPVAGLNRSNPFKNIRVFWKLYKSMQITRKIIKDFDPDVVVGVGGYASGPLLRTASRKGIPTLIQEQNSYAGITNKLLAKNVSKICVAYENMERFFPSDKIVITGNPCRILNIDTPKEDAYNHFELDPTKKTLLVVGGSLGARSINENILKHLDLIDSSIQVLWQTGEKYACEIFVTLTNRKDVGHIHAIPFIDEMGYAYQIADLVISRAGASTISELSILGKPSILVPSPNVSEDHQTKNAMALVNKDAAILIKDAEADKLVAEALKTINDETRLNQLATNIKQMAQYNSAERIVDEIEKIITK